MLLGRILIKSLLRPKHHQKLLAATVSNFKPSQELLIDPKNGNDTNILSNFLQKNRSLTIDEWTEIRSNLLKTTRSGITDYNIDAIILGQCMPNGQINVAKSYMSFLRSTNRNANLATIGRYLKLFYLAGIKGEGNYSITDADKKEIIDM